MTKADQLNKKTAINLLITANNEQEATISELRLKVQSQAVQLKKLLDSLARSKAEFEEYKTPRAIEGGFTVMAGSMSS